MASLRSSASRRSSIFSRRAASTTKFFLKPSLRHTASRARQRSEGSLVAKGFSLAGGMTLLSLRPFYPMIQATALGKGSEKWGQRCLSLFSEEEGLGLGEGSGAEPVE